MLKCSHLVVGQLVEHGQLGVGISESQGQREEKHQVNSLKLSSPSQCNFYDCVVQSRTHRVQEGEARGFRHDQSHGLSMDLTFGSMTPPQLQPKASCETVMVHHLPNQSYTIVACGIRQAILHVKGMIRNMLLPHAPSTLLED